MKHLESTFKARDGLELYSQAWLPHGAMKSVLAFVHGYDDHSARYRFFVKHFQGKGHGVYAFDLRGHGRSQGRRGHVESFETYLSDVGAFLGNVRSENPGSMIFLVGHSMGGLISLSYCLKYPDDLSGVVVSSPFFGLRKSPPKWQMVSIRVLSLLWPNLRLRNRNIPPESLSHDQSIVEAKKTDPLTHHVTTPRWFMEVTKAQALVLNEAHKLRCPLLILYARDDRIVEPALSRAFYEKVTNNDKKILGYGGYHHEVFNEVGRDAVFSDMEEWLTKRLST